MIVTPLVFWSFVAPFFATALRFPVGVKKVPGKSSGFLMYKTDIGSHVDLYEQPAGHNYVITLDGTPEDLEEGDFIVSLNGPNDEGNLGFMNIRVIYGHRHFLLKDYYAADFTFKLRQPVQPFTVPRVTTHREYVSIPNTKAKFAEYGDDAHMHESELLYKNGKGKWKVEVFIPRDMITGPRTVEDFTDQSVSYNYPDVNGESIKAYTRERQSLGIPYVTTHKLAVKQSLLQKIGIM